MLELWNKLNFEEEKTEIIYKCYIELMQNQELYFKLLAPELFFF